MLRAIYMTCQDPFTRNSGQRWTIPLTGQQGPHAHMAPELSTFAARLQHAMDRKKTNANRIEVETGDITRQSIGFMLSGKTAKPTWDKLVLLANHLGVRPHWLADGEGPMLPTPELKDEEIELIEHFRHMSATHRKDLCDIAERWADEDDDGPRPSLRPGLRPPPRRQ